MGCTLNGQSDSTKQQREGEFYRLGLGYVLRTKEFPLTATPKG